MILMLLVLGMMINKARDPAMWRWLASDKEAMQEVGASATPQKHANPTAVPHAKGEARKPAAKPEPAIKVEIAGLGEIPVKLEASKPEAPVQPAPAKADAPVKPAEPVAAAQNKAAPKTPPPEATPAESTDDTDLDPEEMDEAQKEFQAITDKSLAIQRAEMIPYLRLLKWVDNQSEASIEKRAKRGVRFNDLVHAPDEYRGKLIALELNVRAISKCEKLRDKNGVIYDGDLYEIWGFTPDSGAWLYTAIVTDLPEGMPVGPEVIERARLVGYFFKLQGYQERGARPHAKPLYAPALIGRLVWLRDVPAQQVEQSDWYWIAGAAAFFLLIGGGSAATLLLRRRAPLPEGSPSRMRGLPPMDQWLGQAEEGELDSEYDSEEPGEFLDRLGGSDGEGVTR